MKNKGNNGPKIPMKKAIIMAEMSLKKFKKKFGDDFDGKKKKIKKNYYAQLTEILPEAANILVRYSQLKEVNAIKMDIYNKIGDPDYIEFLLDQLEDGEIKAKELILLPILYRDMMMLYKKNSTAQADQKNEDISAWDADGMLSLTVKILKKQLKKAEKAGVDKDIAFDALSIIPTDKVLEDKQVAYRWRQLMNILYTHAKDKEINNFGEIL